MGGARTDRARAARAAPWAGILTVTTGFQVARQEPVDIIVFAGALALVVLDTLLPGGLRPLRGRRALRTRPPLAVLLPAALVVGGVLVTTPRHGPGSVVALAVLGALVTAFALVGDGAGGRPLRDPRGREQRARARRTALLWSGVVVAAGLVEATSFVLGRLGVTDDTTMPSISDLLDPLLDDPRWHALYVVVWLATGVALLRRGAWEGEPWAS